MKNWTERMSRYSTLAGVAFVPDCERKTPVNEGNIALIVFLVAVGLTLLVAGGLAVLMWLLSLRSPHAAVGAEPKSDARSARNCQRVYTCRRPAFSR